MGHRANAKIQSLSSRPASPSVESELDDRGEASLMMIVCRGDFCWRRSHEPLESLLGRCEPTGHESFDWSTKTCKNLAIIYERVVNSFDGILIGDKSGFVGQYLSGDMFPTRRNIVISRKKSILKTQNIILTWRSFWRC
jgi:hypothetical protein